MNRIDVAIAIVLRDSKLLITRRKPGTPLAGYWEFPGGKREGSESIEDCLARELWEELAIRAKPVLAFSQINHTYPHAQVCLHPFLCIHQSGEPRAIESDEVKWISPDQLQQFKFPEANGPLLEQVLRSLPPGGWTAKTGKRTRRAKSQLQDAGH